MQLKQIETKLFFTFTKQLYNIKIKILQFNTILALVDSRTQSAFKSTKHGYEKLRDVDTS